MDEVVSCSYDGTEKSDGTQDTSGLVGVGIELRRARMDSVILRYCDRTHDVPVLYPILL